MIIIYNLSGLLVGLAGIAVGGLTISLTDRPWLGMFTAAVVWIALGFWWRSRTTGQGIKNAYPSVFFIPLPFVGIAVALVSILATVLEMNRGPQAADPRAAQFQADEDRLRAGDVSGDANLSGEIRKVILASSPSSGVNVFTKIEKDRVLVLAKASKLKDVDQEARRRLLQQVLETVDRFPATNGKSAYIGIKGRALYGIVRIPPDTTKIGETVPDELLLDFYGPAPGAAQPTSTTASAQSSPITGSALPSPQTGSASPSRSAP